MNGRWASFDEVRDAFRAHFVELDDSVIELLTVLAFMYAVTPAEAMAKKRAKLREVNRKLLVRNQGRAPGVPPDATHLKLCYERNRLRDALLHQRELIVAQTDARVVDDVEYLPASISMSNDTVLFESKRGTWWSKTLFHGVTLLRAEDLSRGTALEVMNHFGAMTGHRPDARRLSSMLSDPDRHVPSYDRVTRDADTLLDQYKKEKRRRKNCNAAAVLPSSLVIQEKVRLTRESIFLYEFDEGEAPKTR